MRTSLVTRGTPLVLALVLLLAPAAAHAAKDCTIGSGFYSCTFKDDAGNVTQGSLDLSDLANTATFDVSNGVALTASGSCDCQLTGNTKDNGKPPKDNTSVICGGESSLPVGAAAPLGISVSTSAALVGKISGNPSKPLTLKVKGQVHTFNSGGASVGYLFECVGLAPPM